MIEKHLKAFLTQRGNASVLGLGNFFLEYRKPKVDPKSKKISPPGKVVQFRWNPKEKDFGFISFLAKSQKIKVAEAQVQIKKEVESLLKKLGKSKKVEWNDLGEFSGDPTNVIFKSFGKNLHRSGTGMSEVKAPAPVKKVSEDPKKKETVEKPEKVVEEKKEEKKIEEKIPPIIAPSRPDPKPKEIEKPKMDFSKPSDKKGDAVKPEDKPKEKKKKSYAWLWVLLIILLAGSAITLYIINREPAKPPVVVVPEPEPIPEPEPEPIVEEPPPPPKVLTISERTGRFYIILGGFANKDNAMTLRDEIDSKGASDAKVIFSYPPKNLYRVSIQDHETQAEAIEAMVKLRADYGNYIWVLTY